MQEEAVQCVTREIERVITTPYIPSLHVRVWSDSYRTRETNSGYCRISSVPWIMSQVMAFVNGQVASRVRYRF